MYQEHYLYPSISPLQSIVTYTQGFRDHTWVRHASCGSTLVGCPWARLSAFLCKIMLIFIYSVYSCANNWNASMLLWRLNVIMKPSPCPWAMECHPWERWSVDRTWSLPYWCGSGYKDLPRPRADTCSTHCCYSILQESHIQGSQPHISPWVAE